MGTCGIFQMYLHIYNDKLVNIMNIESNPIEAFYIPETSKKMQVCDSFYVYLENSEIVLLDRTTGWAKKRFKIESDYFLLNPSNQETNQEFNLMFFL